MAEVTALVFDTETTSADNKKDPADDRTAKLCQIWAGLYCYDDEKTYLEDVNTEHPVCTIKPVSVLHAVTKSPVPPCKEALAVHGITEEIMDTIGVQGDSIAYIFADLLEKADFLVAHNTWFDKGIMKHHLYQYDLDPALLDGPEEYCTMKRLQPIMKLTPKIYGDWKRPSLIKAYNYIYRRDFEGSAHDASADAIACAEIYFACRFLEKLG